MISLVPKNTSLVKKTAGDLIYCPAVILRSVHINSHNFVEVIDYFRDRLHQVLSLFQLFTSLPKSYL